MSPLSLNNHTEKDLIAMCIDGDSYSCKQLFDMYSRKMMAICYRFARDRNEAEDILQEGFIRIFNKLSLYSGQGALESWMRRVIINTAIKYKKRHIIKHSYSDIDNVHALDTTPSVIDDISRDEILALVQSLPEGYRIVFSLYVIEGYSHKEIADRLEIGESTSRSQLVKARALLRTKLLNHRKLAG